MLTNDELIEALKDATAHLVGAASAYRTYARRHASLRPKAITDPFFQTRTADFEKAAERSVNVLKKALNHVPAT